MTEAGSAVPLNVTVVVFWSGLAETAGAAGAVRSMVNARVASVGSVFPAASVARTRNV